MNSVKVNLKNNALEACSVTIIIITTTIMGMETDTAGVNIHTADHLRVFSWIFYDCFTAVLQLAVVATLVELI